MAVRGRGNRNAFDIWPGFVDALSSLLIIILFVSMVFMAAQFFLGNALSGRDKKINQLNTRIEQLARMLALEQAKGEQARKTLTDIMAELRATITARDKLLAERNRLSGRLAAADKERQDLMKTLGQLEARREMLKALIAKAEAANKELEKKIAGVIGDREDLRRKMNALASEKSALEKRVAGVTGANEALEKRLTTLADRNEALAGQMAKITGAMKLLQEKLAEALAENKVLKAQLEDAKAKLLAAEKAGVALRKDLENARTRGSGLLVRAEEAEKATKEAMELTDKQAAEIVVLNRQLAAIRQQLRAIQEALEASEAKRKGQEVKIKDLSTRLNAALATKVQELQRYRSEFFGRLREALGNRSDVKIVGDRFVFQSEVLFPSGSDELQEGGREQLAKLAKTLKDIAAKIPSDIDWVLRVDGHTDIRPIRTKFVSNWELSAARAIAVVKFLIQEGIPANRVVAAGFGEFHPLDKAETEEAYARNRRIELKITNR